MEGLIMMLLALLACSEPVEKEPGFQFPAASDMPEYRGPGGPNVEFTDAALFENCAQLDGGEQDSDHHNLVIPYRGLRFWPQNGDKVGFHSSMFPTPATSKS